MIVSVSATTTDGTTRSVNVRGDWHKGLGPGSFQDAIPLGLAILDMDDEGTIGIGASVVEEA